MEFVSLKTPIPYKQRINQSQRKRRISLKQTEMLDLSLKPAPQYHFIYVSLPFHILTPLLIQMMKSGWGNNNINL
jgi:16S rRNA A1518/A1519 N6-dimethyltransferase RsmA/KsgA/DIM1 with predicted DNA glycosylase/AP lyase activity